MTGSTQRTAIGQIIPQLRELICVLDVVCDRCRCLSAIPRAFLAKITSAAEDFFTPYLVPMLLVELFQTIASSALKRDAGFCPASHISIIRYNECP